MTNKLTRRTVLMGGAATACLLATGKTDVLASDEVYIVRGWIKWFDATKGYGLIRCERGGPDVLLHIRCLRASGFETAHENATVTAEFMLRPKGLQAVRVLEMGPEPLGPPNPRTHRVKREPTPVA